VATSSLPPHTRFVAALRLARIDMFDGSG